MLGAPTYRRTRSLRRRRRWDAVSWWFSLLFVIPVAILCFYGVRHLAASDPQVTLHVTDAFTGKALGGAQVMVGQTVLTSNGHGEVELALPAAPEIVTVRHADYEPMSGTLGADADSRQAVALRPSLLQGKITDAKSGQPIVGAMVSAFAGNGTKPVSTTTGNDGTYRLTGVPAQARVHIDAGDYGVIEESVGQRTRFDLKLKLSAVTGAVTDAAGKPLQGAVVAVGKAETVTKADGTYRLTGVPDTGDLVVSASGYTSAQMAVPANRTADVKLNPVSIKAIYVTPDAAGNAEQFNHLVHLVDTTELNAMVVDIKEGAIFYDSKVQFFRDAGTVQPAYDATSLLKTLHEHKIYAIARMVVFEDPAVAEKHPDLAVKDVNTGGVWRDGNGVAWVNPFNEQLWQPNIDLAVEAAKLGFDEIQYDYIRFPSDGNLTTADFGHQYTQETRVGAITGFLKESVPAIHAAGAKLGIDIFGITTLYDDDQGIGQYLRAIAPIVDYVCPMLYPSHFTADAIDVGGEPNDHPYEVIKLGLAGAKDKMPGMTLKLRPWLQDFKYPGKRAYTTDDVLAQIKAADEAGTSGWMIWNAGSEFHEDAFAPQT